MKGYFSLPSYRKQNPAVWLPNVTERDDLHIVSCYLSRKRRRKEERTDACQLLVKGMKETVILLTDCVICSNELMV